MVLFGILGAFYNLLRDQSETANKALVPPQIKYNVGVRNAFDEADFSWDKQRIKEFVERAKNNKHLFVDYTNLAKAIMPETLSYMNKTNKWKSGFENQTYFNITGPFIVKLGLYGNKNPSGISMNGRLSQNNIQWWKGISNIFFGVGNGGERLYIDIKSNDPEPIVLFDETLNKRIDGVYVMFNKKGTSLLVTDLNFDKIIFIDINRTTKNRFPSGLFPDNKFYVGYNIAPLSDLTISDLSIL